MTFVDPVEKYSAYYLAVVQFEKSRCIISIRNQECYAVSFSPGLNILYLDCRSKGSSLPWHTISEVILVMQNHTYMPDGMLHSILSPDTLKQQINKRDIPPHIVI